MKKRKPERYGAVDRTFEIKLDKRPTGLRAVRVVIIILLAAVVVALIAVGSKLYWSNTERESARQTVQSNNSADEELLRVVNKTNPLDKNFVPELVERDGYSVSPLADESLELLLNAAGESGVELKVESAYISYAEQSKLYNKRLKYNREKYNLSEVRAQAKTEAEVPQAGDSEAQTGLLVTFKTGGKFDGSRASRWLRDNCVKYGFVQRYPSDKTDSTSMNANPKVYRYVGKDNAEMMRSLNKSLNEYVLYINSR